MKQVAVPVVEQWNNSTEYFLKFLSSKKMPEKKIKKTVKCWYETAEAFEDSITLCVILCFYSPRFWNNSVRHAIIVTKFDDEIY